MSSIIEGYSYDIFISYRQKDNKGDMWVSEFAEALKIELESTFKEELSVYFDINPHDGLLETYDVDASLKDKLKCLVFIPIISRTYCDPKSFAWEHEFKTFVQQTSVDQFGLKVKLPNGNVVSRVLPIRIYDLDIVDIKLCESVLGSVLRGVDFIYKSPGVNRPLLSGEENPQDNLNHTNYRDQINKVANAIKDIIICLISESNKQIDLIEPKTIEPKINKKSELNFKASKFKIKYSPIDLFNKVPSIKKLILPILLLVSLLIIIGLLYLLKSKDNYGTTVIHSNIPVESTLMDAIGQIPVFVISPDGQTIAYGSEDGIKVKTLSNFSTNILEGTLNTGTVEFSPDGQFLAFTNLRGINKVGINGSPMSAVLQSGGLGLFWGMDGNIYFSAGLGSEGIWRVSVNGGEPERLTYVLDSLGENAHTWPQLLPDSKTLLYTSLGPSGGSIDSKIVIMKLDTKERKVLVNNAIFGRYLSNGNILYANNEGNIFILPFNLRKLKILGEPKAVLSGVNTSTWGGAAFLSVSETGNMVYLPRNTVTLRVINVVDRFGKSIDKDSIPSMTIEKMGLGVSGISISPSGKLIACTGITYGSLDIWLINLDSKDIERITFDPSEDEAPVWSPDGNAIAYSSAMTGTTRRLFIKDLGSAGNSHLIRTWPRHIHFSSWSPDGKWLAAYDYSPTNGTDCYAISIDSGKFIPIATSLSNESNGQFSPDGRWLTFQSDESGRPEIYVVSFPKLVSKKQISEGGGSLPRWDRSGKFIYYLNDNYLVAQPVEISNEFKKGKPVKLFLANASSYDLSPDGEKFYIIRKNLKRLNPPLNLITNWFQELKGEKDK